MNIFRHLRKNISLRIVNFVGLSIMFACLLLSVGYIRHETSYDRHNINADRIVRISLQFDNEPVDGRIVDSALDDILCQIPEVERTVKMHKIKSDVLVHRGRQHVVKDYYIVSRDFPQLFNIQLLHGDKDRVMQSREQALISESLARQLFGEIDYNAYEMTFEINGFKFFVSGIFKDLPETSHFHADMLLPLMDGERSYAYTYLLLRSNRTDIKALEKKITEHIDGVELPQYSLSQPSQTRALLMPLTDIHLHSHNLREMSVNGNIYYIYLIIGANALLLIVVLFNLWLNTSLIFSYNRRHYQILSICGASSSEVHKDESLLALLLGSISMVAGLVIVHYVLMSGYIPGQINLFETALLCLLFLAAVVAVSLLPAMQSITHTLFINSNIELKPVRFSYSNVKYMLMVQYGVVMIVVILAFGINKQMNLVKDMQIGGNEQSILVVSDQPTQVQENYALLKGELMNHPEIEMITSAFQLPGDAIRDMTNVRKEGSTNWQALPILVASEGFLPFFEIPLLAGRGFSPGKHDYQAEFTMLMDRLERQKYSEETEEYIINRKALSILGFNTPQEAVGEMLHIEHSTIDYFRKGVIVAVTDDFNYTGLYEETIPLLIMQRTFFQNCIMVRLDPKNLRQSRNVFEKVWHEVNPDYPADYHFMNDVFERIYHNEINAERLVYIFSLLCFFIADLGLIIFMAFIVRRRSREVGIRKVHGARVGDIIAMLNVNFIRYIALPFIFVTPLAWYIMERWLERFAYRTSLDWWIFALAGLSVLLISVASVSLQSWRAASANPVNVISEN